MILATLLIWAAPAQVILISTLGSASLIEVALAVSLSSVRFMPMVVALLPMLKDANTRPHQLILPAHLTAISAWVEAMLGFEVYAHHTYTALQRGPHGEHHNG